MTRKGTPRSPWSALRSNVAADDSTLITTFENDNSTYTTSMWKIPSWADSIAIAFWGKDTENDTGSYKLFGRNKGNGPIMSVAAGNIILGARLITKDPLSPFAAETAYWVDSITNTVEWIKTPVVKNHGNDTIAYLAINVKDLQDVYLEFTAVGGGGAEMTEVNAIITAMKD